MALVWKTLGASLAADAGTKPAPFASVASAAHEADRQTKNAARAWLDPTRGRMIHNDALARLVAASQHSDAVNSMSSVAHDGGSLLKTLASNLLATQLAFQKLRREGEQQNEAAMADLSKAFENEPPPQPSVDLVLQERFSARTITDRVVKTHSHASGVASRLDADLDAFIQNLPGTMLAMETRRLREHSDAEQRLQKEQAEHEQTREQLSRELQNEQYERLMAAERYEADIQTLKLQTSRALGATCSVLKGALRHSECEWLADVSHWTEVAAELTQDLATAHKKHAKHVAALSQEAMRDRARRVCLQLCFDARMSQAAKEADALRAELRTVKEAKAQSEATYMLKLEQLKLELKRVDEVNAVLRAAEARKATVLGKEIMRLRSLMNDALEAGLGYQHPEKARQRLYFESLKRQDLHRDEPSLSHMHTLTKRGWHDEPFVSPKSTPPSPTQPPTHRPPPSPRAASATSPSFTASRQRQPLHPPTGQRGMTKRRYYGQIPVVSIAKIQTSAVASRAVESRSEIGG